MFTRYLLSMTFCVAVRSVWVGRYLCTVAVQLRWLASCGANCCVSATLGLFARACKALGQPAVCASIADDAANLRGVLIERLAEMSVRHADVLPNLVLHHMRPH